MAVFTLQKLRANELSRTFDVSVVSSAEIVYVVLSNVVTLVDGVANTVPTVLQPVSVPASKSSFTKLTGTACADAAVSEAATMAAFAIFLKFTIQISLSGPVRVVRVENHPIAAASEDTQ